MSTYSGAIVAVTRHAERRIVERLRESDATSPAKAQPLPDLRWIEERRLHRLVAAGAIQETSNGSYFVNESVLDAYLQQRRGRVFAVLGAAVLAALGIASVGRK